MNKRILGLIIAVASLFIIGTSAYAATYVNNEDVSDTVFTTISNDYTLFPVRYLGEKLGCDVYWNPNDKCITVSKGDVYRDFYNDSPVVYDWNGNSYNLVTAPKLVDGNTMVPAEFYRDHFGVSVLWDAMTSSLFINSEDTYNWLINTDEYINATTPINIYDTLSKEQKKDLNVFLSNFSEANFDNYNCQNIDANRLISFAFTHSKINNTSSIKYYDSNMGFSADRCEEVLDKYFGINIPRQSTSDWWYDGSYYWTPGATGETYGSFSVAVNMYDLKNGTYNVSYNEYAWDGYGLMDTVSDKYYWYNDWDASHDNNWRIIASGVATIKPVVYNDKNTWQLLQLITY